MLLAGLRDLIPSDLRDRLRPLARRMRLARPQGEWAEAQVSPWRPPTMSEATAGAWCLICRWQGDEFIGGFNSELSRCPQCGSIARDRFLLAAWFRRSPKPSTRLRVLETSPRLGDDYRRAMGGWFDYLASDFDESAHRGSVRLDLQAIDLPDGSLDVILSAHVVEHTTDPDVVFAEIHRVLAPGGMLYLQVPVLHASTRRPSGVEYHGDNTLVHWRFGLDLTDRLRVVGFETTLLVTQDWLDLVAAGPDAIAGVPTGDIDAIDLLGAPNAADCMALLDPATARRYGFLPPWQYFTWECRRVG